MQEKSRCTVNVSKSYPVWHHLPWWLHTQLKVLVGWHLLSTSATISLACPLPQPLHAFTHGIPSAWRALPFLLFLKNFFLCSSKLSLRSYPLKKSLSLTANDWVLLCPAQPTAVRNSNLYCPLDLECLFVSSGHTRWGVLKKNKRFSEWIEERGGRKKGKKDGSILEQPHRDTYLYPVEQAIR